jgi:hypothetical protein
MSRSCWRPSSIFSWILSPQSSGYLRESSHASARQSSRAAMCRREASLPCASASACSSSAANAAYGCLPSSASAIQCRSVRSSMPAMRHATFRGTLSLMYWVMVSRTLGVHFVGRAMRAVGAGCTRRDGPSGKLSYLGGKLSSVVGAVCSGKRATELGARI